VLHVIERDGLLANAAAVGATLAGVPQHPLISGVRGAGLLRAIALAEPVAAEVARAALDAGFIVNPVTPDALRLAPPLILTAAQAGEFLDALPGILEAQQEAQQDAQQEAG
ncbi:MAG: aminotransferase class III-fold pyridoxal phosphate-dependent enzyme, partial [Actinomycetota bacterium]